MYYKSITSFNNLTYSVDMLRVKTYITYSKFTELEFRLDVAFKNLVYKKYTSSKMKDFFYNYVIEIEEGRSFYFGFLHNSERRLEDANAKYNFTLEFNPNKIKDDSLIFYILSMSNDWYLKSYDLAVDLRVNILDIIVDQGLKRTLQFYSNGFDNKTYRVGKNDKKVKIYNKKIESKLDVDYDLTRIEISRCYDDYPIKNIKLLNFGVDNFPNLYLNKYICSLSDYADKTLYAVIFAVQNGYPIKELSRAYKSKIKKLFEGGQKIRFTDKDATDILRQVIFSYFININKFM